jgi:hypothetical protein
MVGNLLGLWLTGILEDALKELVAKEPDPSLLDQLRALEAADHKAFMSKELPSILNNQELPDDIDRELLPYSKTSVRDEASRNIDRELSGWRGYLE